ncbi:MAG: hypothetical protein Q9161_008999 [Pseudevernia consocians]
MEEAYPTFEHEFQYPFTEWGSLPLEAHLKFTDFGTRGDPDYDIIPQVEYQTIDEAFEDVMNEIEMHARLSQACSSLSQACSGHTGHTERQHEHQQYSSEMQSELQPVFLQDNTNLIDNNTCTKSGGVSSPAKVPPIRNSQITVSAYHCPRCDIKLCSRSTVKAHFPRCIMKHGNPDALKWDDHISLQPLRKGEMKDKARNDRFRDCLEAYSGVAIPSKLWPGQVIVKFVSSVTRVGRAKHLCAVCGGGPFSLTCHVKSHFIGCVRRYGNPTAANWYDRLDPKHIKKYLLGRPDATVNTPPTM